jgi:hypothetical protein
MYLVREIFKCKPGKAKEIVKVFKKALPIMEKDGISNSKVMTDLATDYWTVVVEFEVKNLEEFGSKLRGETADPKLAEIFKGYMDNVESGKREMFILE